METYDTARTGSFEFSIFFLTLVHASNLHRELLIMTRTSFKAAHAHAPLMLCIASDHLTATL